MYQSTYIGTPLRLKYLLESYMEPLGLFLPPLLSWQLPFEESGWGFRGLGFRV